MRLLQILSVEKFKEWLESKDDNEVVGFAIKQRSCPIANFLKEEGFSNVFVRQEEIYGFDKEENEYAYLVVSKNELEELSGILKEHNKFQNNVGYLPDWVVDFIEVIDEQSSSVILDNDEVAIKARFALEILTSSLFY